jgi:hypothetical protein
MAFAPSLRSTLSSVSPATTAADASGVHHEAPAGLEFGLAGVIDRDVGGLGREGVHARLPGAYRRLSSAEFIHAFLIIMIDGFVKFRTMKVLEDGDRIVQASHGDERVTRIGRLLRRTSIDELPQLFNVLHGNMSLVGPRPHALAHDDEYKARIASYAVRHHVRPGLTGAAQIVGLRGETKSLEQMEQRVEQDL